MGQLWPHAACALESTSIFDLPCLPVVVGPAVLVVISPEGSGSTGTSGRLALTPKYRRHAAARVRIGHSEVLGTS